MSDTTVCRVKNSVDNEFITLCTKWSNENVEIIILRRGDEPLRGKEQLSQLVELAENFNKTQEEYLGDIRLELAGKDAGIEFSIKNECFQWKRRPWKRGIIRCQPVKNIIEFSSSIMDVIMRCANIEEDRLKLESENEALRKRSAELERSLNDLIALKNSMEDELTKKFIILLNSKKKYNEELRRNIQSCSSVYDQQTDESEIEAENDEESRTKSMKSKDFISKPISNGSSNLSKNSKNLISNPSTSSKTIPANDSFDQLLENSNGKNNDSDESFVLKITPSPPREKRKRKDNFIEMEDDSESDMFSD